jgi:predicted transcriptional regulator
LSIRPEYANAIFHGGKKYEFRRIIFSRKVDIIVVYVTSPVRKVVAEFDVISIISEPLFNLWDKTWKFAGIDITVFLKYFKGCKEGHAIEIGEVRLYNEPFCPVKKFGLRPPQLFSYLVSQGSILSDYYS